MSSRRVNDSMTEGFWMQTGFSMTPICRANIPSSSDSGEIVPGHRTRYDLPLFVRISS